MGQSCDRYKIYRRDISFMSQWEVHDHDKVARTWAKLYGNSIVWIDLSELHVHIVPHLFCKQGPTTNLNGRSVFSACFDIDEFAFLSFQTACRRPHYTFYLNFAGNLKHLIWLDAKLSIHESICAHGILSRFALKVCLSVSSASK